MRKQLREPKPQRTLNRGILIKPKMTALKHQNYTSEMPTLQVFFDKSYFYKKEEILRGYQKLIKLNYS